MVAKWVACRLLPWWIRVQFSIWAELEKKMYLNFQFNQAYIGYQDKGLGKVKVVSMILTTLPTEYQVVYKIWLLT